MGADRRSKDICRVLQLDAKDHGSLSLTKLWRTVFQCYLASTVRGDSLFIEIRGVSLRTTATEPSVRGFWRLSRWQRDPQALQANSSDQHSTGDNNNTYIHAVIVTPASEK